MSAHDSPTVAARRARLQAWIDAHHEGAQAAFIEKTKINQGELSALLKPGGKSFGEKKAENLERLAGMPNGYLVTPSTETERLSASQSTRFDDATMAQALELLYLLADARPEDRRFQRPTWAMILIAAKAITKAEGTPREAMAEILAAFAREN